MGKYTEDSLLSVIANQPETVTPNTPKKNIIIVTNKYGIPELKVKPSKSGIKIIS